MELDSEERFEYYKSYHDLFLTSCKTGGVSFIESLIRDKNFDFLIDDKIGIMYSILYDQSEVFKLLVGILNLTHYDENDILDNVFLENKLEIAKIILDGDVFDLSKIRHYTGKIASLGHIEMLKLINEYPEFQRDVYSQRVFRRACKEGHFDIVEMLIDDPRIDPALNDNESLIGACQEGRLDVIDRLLKDPRIDPNSPRNKPLAYACKGGHIEVVRRLLADPSVDANNDANSALYNACEHYKLDIVKLLLEHPKVDPTVSGNIGLSNAIYRNDIKLVSILLSDKRIADSCPSDYFTIRKIILMNDMSVIRPMLASIRVTDDDLKSVIRHSRSRHMTPEVSNELKICVELGLDAYRKLNQNEIECFIKLS